MPRADRQPHVRPKSAVQAAAQCRFGRPLRLALRARGRGDHQIMTIVLRLVFVLFGFLFIWMGVDCIRRVCTYRGVPLPGIAAYLQCAMGVGMIVYGLASKNVSKEFGVRICSACRSVFRAKDVIGTACPKCSGQVEDLKGFYERHPELKDDSRGK